MIRHEQKSKLVAKDRPLPSEAYSAKALPHVLGTFDMTAMYLAVIFFIGNTPSIASGGVVALTYLLLGGLTFFLPCVVATAQLGVLFPHDGSLYNWTHKALGPYWGFFAGVGFWLPNVLAMVGAADGFVTFLQGVNNSWLTEPWQQGAVILAVIAFTVLLSIQRLRTAQNVVNVIIVLTLGVVALVALAGLFSLLHNGSRTPLDHLSAWQINPQNFSLFGLIAFLYLGTAVPMNMAGELRKRSSITRHLLWGSILILLSYFISTFALLITRGSDLTRATVLPYEVATLITSVFGKVIGNISAVCILSFYLTAALVFNYATARLLFTASIDQRLPLFLGRLNKHRAPQHAIIFQSLIACILVIIIFFVAPYISLLDKSPNLAIEAYNALLAAMTVIWGLANLFFFLDLLAIYLHNRQRFHEKRIFPMWILWICILIGPATCLVVAVDTLLNSWTPLIPTTSWWYIVGA
ncbi:APC family permease [Ktedonosporobacter rubrisoli]|uniref:APC family permease n=1 Tax=Ktedonosporobacter rubrisoli TaxID=2509675 RepID=A0A4V0YZ58_KTERU|nr:APC family permease [Ktedonosporobacter rubrisoli]QBD78571.1 APC family permease [Ktedonosporobacter rubrisoli]